jgi:hypothetical protein
MAKKIFTKFLFLSQIIAVFVLFASPVFIHAQGASTPGTGITYECQRQVNGVTVYGDCGYGDLIAAVKRVIDWMIIFTLEFSVVVIAYAGFNYLISGDNPSKRAEANKMLTKVAIGIFFVLAAWLIVNLIATALLNSSVAGMNPIRT